MARRSKPREGPDPLYDADDDGPRGVFDDPFDNGMIILIAIVLALVVVFFTGCATLQTSDAVRTKSETELAVAAVKKEWLIPCEGLAAVVPTNDIGTLLQDYADMATAFATCQKLHKSFVDYMAPIVQKERIGPQPAPK